MGEAVDQIQDQFWRPPIQSASEAAASHLGETCGRCGTEFIVGSRFCHSCGGHRPDSNSASTAARIPGLAELASVRDWLGLSTASCIAFFVGMICLLGALGVGVLFGAKTLLDWQAIQLWRIEWLLGAVAAFVAGCLLRNSKPS